MQATELFEKLEVFSDKVKKCIRYLLGPELKEIGLKSYHILFLLPIERSSGMSQKDLRECVPYDKSRVSMVIGELVALGMVIDEGKGKTSVLRLTDAGEDACCRFRNLMTGFNSEIISVLAEGELEEFVGCMDKFSVRIDEILEQHGVSSGQIADKVRECDPQPAFRFRLKILLVRIFGAAGKILRKCGLEL